jgi:hypothetical protein
VEEPPPVGAEGQEGPGGSGERAGGVGEGGVDGDDQVEVLEDGGGVGVGQELVADGCDGITALPPPTLPPTFQFFFALAFLEGDEVVAVGLVEDGLELIESDGASGFDLGALPEEADAGFARGVGGCELVEALLPGAHEVGGCVEVRGVGGDGVEGGLEDAGDGEEREGEVGAGVRRVDVGGVGEPGKGAEQVVEGGEGGEGEGGVGVEVLEDGDVAAELEGVAEALFDVEQEVSAAEGRAVPFGVGDGELLVSDFPSGFEEFEAFDEVGVEQFEDGEVVGDGGVFGVELEGTSPVGAGLADLEELDA